MNIRHVIYSLKNAALLIVFFTLLFGGVYPGIITLCLQTVFPYQANGSIIYKDKNVIGSELIGQNVTDPKYFWGRPSATSPFRYDPIDSSGSNLCPASPILQYQINVRINHLLDEPHNPESQIPIDLVTASASGLDPHISLASAYYQLDRISKYRQIPKELLYKLIEKQSIPRQWGVLGEPRINVLMLNLALDHEFERQ